MRRCAEARARPSTPLGRGELALRRLELPLDHHRALQARRLHAGRDRAAPHLHRGACPSTRSTRPAWIYDPAERAPILDEYPRSRSSAPARPPAGDGPPTAADGDCRSDHRQSRRRAPKRKTGLLPSIALGRLSWQSADGPRRPGRRSGRLCLRHPPADQRPPLLRRLCEGGRPARASLDRLELFQDDWGYLLLWATLRHRLRAGRDAGRCCPWSSAGGRSSATTPASPAPSSISPASASATSWSRSASSAASSLALANPTVSADGADHRHAGLLRPRQPRSRAASSTAAGTVMPVVFVADRRAAVRLRPPPRSGPRLDRHACLCAGVWCSRSCPDRAADVPDGLPNGGRHDLAGAAREGPHVPLGLGDQRLLLGDRRGAGADRRHRLRPRRVLDVSAVAYLLAIPALMAVLLPRRPLAAHGAGMITRRDSSALPPRVSPSP